ncbi:hypothetical protein FACS1894170_06180 [Planctomycetales bacterium]|nr:hypothetical protein FACS1894170_06180 [Planctomycetales bacterium]
MRLISLEASDPGFKKVVFNRRGLSFIRAKQAKTEQSDLNKTYNGVGKSLLIALIHFCLGSDKKPSLGEKLPDWTFYLTIQINEEEIILARSTGEQTYIYINEEKYNFQKCREYLGEKCFKIPSEFPYLSFRSLLPFFIRPKRTSYLHYDKPEERWKPYQQQLCLAFLLGLNIDIARQKHALREEFKNIQDWRKNAKNDELLKRFLSGGQSPDLKVIEIEEKINVLTKDIQSFEIAEDYDDVVKQADVLKRILMENRNELNIIDVQINNIEMNLHIEPELQSDKIVRLYNNAIKVLQESVVRTLQEVEAFHRQLGENRKRRLWGQKTALLSQQKLLETKQHEIQAQIDKCLMYLGEHHAIDMYRSICQQREDLIQQKDRINAHQKLLDEYKEKELSIRQDILKTIEHTRRYLEDSKEYIEKTRDFFRKIAKRFYPNATSGITVECNDGDNQNCYNIEARIESDPSGGIGYVKIFCFDMTLLFYGYRHSMKCLVHDSVIYSETDEIHKVEWFKILGEFFDKNDSDYQYIASINENQLHDIKNNLTPEEYKRIFEDNIVLELTDDGDSGKLLGITVDLDYE